MQLFFFFLLFLLIVEVALRVIAWLKKTFFVKEVSRKDFLAEEYQDYIRRVEDWTKPMFYYLPIGLRLFNLKNPIPGRVENNSLGFRCPEFTPPDPNTLRIALLGGSAAWGSGASDNGATIAGQLEKILNQNRSLLGSYKKAQCYNLAQINGYQTQDVLTLLFFCSKIKPNIVISFSGWNELVAMETMSKEILEKYGVFYMNEMEGWEPINIAGNKTKLLKDALIIWIKEHSKLARLTAQYASPAGEVRRGMPIDEMIKVGTALFKNHLKILHAVSNAYNARHVQFLQPYLYRKKILTPEEQKIIHLYDDLRPVHGGKETGNFLRSHNIYAPMLGEIQNDPDLFGRIHDLCDLFREELATRFYTLVHLNDAGYNEVARKIHDLL